MKKEGLMPGLTEKPKIKDFLLICIAVFLLRTVIQMQSSTFALYLTGILGYSKTTVGLLASIASFAAIFMRPVTGILIDSNKSKTAQILGASLFIIGVTLSSFCTPLFLLFIFRFCFGAGQALFVTSASAAAAEVFPEDRMKEGLGYFGLTSSLSQAIGAVFALSLVLAIGFRGQFLIAIGIAAISLIPVIFVQIPVHTHRINVQEPDVKKDYSKWYDRIFEKSAVLLALIMFLTESGMSTTSTFLPIRAAELGIVNIGVFYTVKAISITATRTFGAKLTQGKIEKPMVIVSQSIIVLSLILIFFSTKLWHYIVIAVFYGFANGNIYISMHTLIVMNAPYERRGMAHSTYYLSNDLASSISLAIWGIICDLLGTRSIYILGSLFPFIAAVIFTLNYLLPRKEVVPSS